MTTPKKPEPDGYIAEYQGDASRYGEFGAGKYIPVCVNRDDLEREYGKNPAWVIKPVYFSTEPPVPKELLEWVEKVRSTFQDAADSKNAKEKLTGEDFYFDIDQQIRLLTELESILPGEIK